jgi:hypothetical protein
MAKEEGFPVQVVVNDSAAVNKDISNDITNFAVATSRGEQDITGLDSAATERLLLLEDAEVQFTGVFNEALSHRVFRDCDAGNPREIRIVLTGGGGLDQLTMQLVFSSYIVTRGADGSLIWGASGKLADGTVPTFSDSGAGGFDDGFDVGFDPGFGP